MSLHDDLRALRRLLGDGVHYTTYDDAGTPADVTVTRERVVVEYGDELGELGERHWDTMGGSETRYLPYTIRYDGTSVDLCVDGADFLTLTVDQANRACDLAVAVDALGGQLAELADGLPFRLTVDVATGDMAVGHGASDVLYTLHDVTFACGFLPVLEQAHARAAAQLARAADSLRSRLAAAERTPVALAEADGTLRLVETTPV